MKNKTKENNMNELTITNSNTPVEFTNEQIDLMKRTIAKDASNDELAMFVNQCKRTGLDPFTRQIYFIKNPKDGKVQIQTSIDGFRLVAERSKQYEGQAKPEWCGGDGVWKDVWLSKELPAAARIGVYKKGFREPLYAIALFDEYAQRKYDGNLTFMWDKMPALMISKVAESLALRKAFPNDLSGLYTAEEMQQADYEKKGWMSDIKKQADLDAEEMAKDAPFDGTYRVPFSTFKGRTITECLEVFGEAKLENAIVLCEERIKSNDPYKGCTIQQLQEFVGQASKELIKIQKGANDSIDEYDMEPVEP